MSSADYPEYPGIDDRELIDLAVRAIGTYSPTYREGPAVDLFETAAAERSLPVRRQRVTSPARTRTAGRDGHNPGHNLIIEVGPQPPALLLVGHIDTVAGDGRQRAAARLEDGRITGLGSADMKGACAAMLLAAADVASGGLRASGAKAGAANDRGRTPGGSAGGGPADRTPPARGFAVHLLVGEEEYGDGAKAAVSELDSASKNAALSELDSASVIAPASDRATTSGHVSASEFACPAPPLVVVGEPTGLRPCTEHAAYYEGTLRTGGRSAHAALPAHGANAITAMLDWLDEIDARASAHESLVINPRSIRGGSDHFLVPDTCEVQIDVHTAPETGETEIERILAESARFAEQRRPGRTYDWSRSFFSPGFRPASDDRSSAPLRAALERVGRPWRPDTFASHSDAPTYAAAGMPTVVLGPGSLEVAHTGVEFVKVSELVAARRLYGEFIRRVCGV